MRKLILIAIVLSVIIATSVAWAKARETITADYDVLWNTAVRLIRVDLNFEILDKDKDVGYIVFNYHDSKRKPARASVEFLREKSDKDPKKKKLERTTLLISISNASSIEENTFISALKKKLHDER